MKRLLTATLLSLCPLIAGAQNNGGASLTTVPNPNFEAPEVVLEAPGAVLRALDKSTGRASDIDIARGQTVLLGRIAVRLMECRYPEDTPEAEAYAHLQVLNLEGDALFDGWMIASSPALSALEHPRYDVWVLRCRIS